MDKDGRSLEATFAEWRDLERSEAPTFEELVEEGAALRGMGPPSVRPHQHWVRPVAWVGIAAAAVVAALWVSAERQDRLFEAALERAVSETRLGSWRGPSDFLMDVPGLEYYASVPSITSGWEGWGAPPGALAPPDSQRRRP